MTQALAVSAPLRARIGFLLFGATASAMAASQCGPTASLVAKAFSGGPPVITGRLGAATFDPNRVQPFVLKAASAAEADRAIRCMTDALYYEAAREPLAGQRAVAQVVVNRVRDPHFPKSVCGVVYEGWRRRTGCQFSFVCDGSIRRRHADPALWSSLRPIAEQALNGHVEPSVGTATHYYAAYVRPTWVRSVARITGIGRHIFCRWKGKAGLPSALRQSYQGGELQIADAALDGGLPQSAARQGRRRG